MEVVIELHIMELSKCPDAQLLEAVFATLPSETQRFKKLVSSQARHRFLATRALLMFAVESITKKLCLSATLGRLHRGKPYFQSIEPFANIAFNMSHSASRVAVALTSYPTVVGVDVEDNLPIPEAPSLIRNYFGLEEVAAASSLPRDSISSHFLKSWCIKEAFHKATGDGLLGDLSTPTILMQEEKLSVRFPDGPALPNQIALFEVGRSPRSSYVSVSYRADAPCKFSLRTNFAEQSPDGRLTATPPDQQPPLVRLGNNFTGGDA